MLPKVKKLKLKNRRPTPNIAITQDCCPNVIIIIFLVLLNFQILFFHFLRLFLTVLYCNVANNKLNKTKKIAF